MRELFEKTAKKGGKRVKEYTEEQVLELHDWDCDEVYAIKLYFNALRANETNACPTLKCTSKKDLNDQLKGIIINYYVNEMARGARNHLQFVWGYSKDFEELHKEFCKLWGTIEYSY